MSGKAAALEPPPLQEQEDDKWKAALEAYREVADNHKGTAFAKSSMTILAAL